jgi:hypothetical protein
MADKAETATAFMTALHDTFLEGPALHRFLQTRNNALPISMFGTTKSRKASFLNHERLKK